MAQYGMEKSPPLRGEVRVQRSKNAVLPMMACAVLTREALELAEVPRLTDVDGMAALLGGIGVQVSRARGGMRLCGENLDGCRAEGIFAERMRASVLLLGPLLVRLGRAHLSFPGGCAIGSRPIDLHLKGLSAMGARFALQEGCVEARTDGLHGAVIYLDVPSVGATENLLMAATLAKGVTVIDNAAKEPEIADLARLLRRMGAKISGIGQSRLTVEGVPALHGARFTPMPDRIEAGTLMLCAAATRGDVLLRGAQADTLGAVIAKMRECGAQVTAESAGLRVRAAEDGTVTRVWEDPLMGNCIEITHREGYITRYGSLATPGLVQEGAKVACGQVLGTMGTSAAIECAEGPHLHFELWQLQEALDPMKFLREDVE